MKKLAKVLFVIVIMFMLTACGAKEELTASEFEEIMKEHGFYVNDLTNDMEDSGISGVYAANNNEFQVEFYVFKSEDLAKDAFNSNLDMFEENKDYAGDEKSEDTYDTYTQQTEDYYNVLRRVGKTLFYASVNVDYKNDVKSIIKNLGY